MKHLTTTTVHFSSLGQLSKKQDLFSVNPEVDAQDALNSASELILGVTGLLEDAAMGEKPIEGSNAFMLAHALESARASVVAVLGRLEKLNDLTPGA